MIILKEYKDIVSNLKKAQEFKNPEDQLNLIVNILEGILEDYEWRLKRLSQHHDNIKNLSEELDEIIKTLPQGVKGEILDNAYSAISRTINNNLYEIASFKEEVKYQKEEMNDLLDRSKSLLDEILKKPSYDTTLKAQLYDIYSNLDNIEQKMELLEKITSKWERNEYNFNFIEKHLNNIYRSIEEIKKNTPENLESFQKYLHEIKRTITDYSNDLQGHYKNLENTIKTIKEFKESVKEIKKNLDKYKDQLREEFKKEAREEFEEERRKHERYRRGMGYIINAVTGTGSGMAFSYFNVPKIYGIPAGTILSTLVGKFFEGDWASTKKKKVEDEKKKEDTILSLAKNIGPHLLIGGLSTFTGYLIMDYLKKNKFGRK
jgi:uncharacterized protein YoxC